MIRRCQKCKEKYDIKEVSLMSWETPRLPQSLYNWICPYCGNSNPITYSSLSKEIKEKLQ